MQLVEDKANHFFNVYFQDKSKTFENDQSFTELSKTAQLLKCGLDFKSFKNPSNNFPKAIKQYGFIKKYDKICQAIPYVSAYRPEQLQTDQILAIITQIYDCYLSFVKKGIWKSQQRQSYLQQLTLLYLYQLFSKAEPKVKRKYGTFDRYLLNMFYTMNILKTCNKYVKNFANFLNSSYSFGEFFLYICLRNVVVFEGSQEMVDSVIIKKIIKIFQAEELSHNVSLSISKDSLDLEQGKLVSINSIFMQPIGATLAVPKVKMYKIMKICKIIQQNSIAEKQAVEWGDFLKKYFEMVQQEPNLCFEHIVSAAVVKNTYQLSKKILTGYSIQSQQQFLQQAFTYIFEVLEMVFAENELIMQDERTLKNIQNLRVHYKYMKSLNQHNMTITNKFSKKLLKNSYILELYKKYS